MNSQAASGQRAPAPTFPKKIELPVKPPPWVPPRAENP